MKTERYFIIYKPVNMVSQFISTHQVKLLGDLNFDFPDGTHAIGRLDQHSEGLLLLTTNKKITKLLFQGIKPHTRTYLVQVKNKVSKETAKQLSEGIEISASGGGRYRTSTCLVKIVDKPNYITEPEIPLDPNADYSWLEISLTEGKFHQVRKMVAAVHHKCSRLIRISIEEMNIKNLSPGEVKEVDEQFFFKKLNL
ncbi:MAG: pseudouridine synthase [Sediminibacterium sp.]